VRTSPQFGSITTRFWQSPPACGEVSEDRREQRVEELLVQLDDGRARRRPARFRRAHPLALRQARVRRADEEEVRARAAQQHAQDEG
jgi:hypothetical protein